MLPLRHEIKSLVLKGNLIISHLWSGGPLVNEKKTQALNKDSVDDCYKQDNKNNCSVYWFLFIIIVIIMIMIMIIIIIVIITIMIVTIIIIIIIYDCYFFFSLLLLSLLLLV